MSNIKQFVGVTGLLTASLAAGYFAYNAGRPAPAETAVATAAAPTETTNIEAIELNAPDGTVLTLSEWSGQPQIVNFWATWCAPCREEMPVLVKAQKDYADQGLVVIGLSMDYPEDTELVNQFIDEYGVEFPILMAVEHGNTLAEGYGAENFVLPISVFVAADGTVSSVHTGLLTEEEAEAELSKLF